MEEVYSSSSEKSRMHGKGNGRLDAGELLRVAVKSGDFSVHMPANVTGIAGKICNALNDVIQFKDQMTEECEEK